LNQVRNILICPLEWGLGHAGRMIALAEKLRERGNNIIIGAGEEHLVFFRKEMPGFSFIDFPGYKPGYSKFLPQYLKLLLNTPVLIFHIICEHRKLREIIREYDVDMVISDNRFGLWNKKIISVYVTHMPRIPFPAPFSFLEFIGILLHRMIIKRYTLCFIPDLPGEINISGRLSHDLRLPVNIRYIGLLSRFSELNTKSADNPVNVRHNTIILSGPEPQREIFKKKLSDIFFDKEPVSVFLGGKPEGTGEMLQSGNIIWYDHLCTAEMKELIKSSEFIITRAGYTVIMELISLGCSALLIPTPGQTEQEYLARTLMEKGWFATIPQKELKTKISLVPIKPALSDQLMVQSKILLDKAVDELLVKEQKEC
jgi:spore coat polysaccharide biosynthesis predicted glycosyltransferase SpsG